MLRGLLDAFTPSPEVQPTNALNPRALLYGAGTGLLGLLNDRKSPLVANAFAGAEQFNQQQKKQEMLQTLNDPAVLTDPNRKQQVALALLRSGDKDLIGIAGKLLSTGASNSPYTLSPGQIRYDANGNVIADRSQDVSASTRATNDRSNLITWTSLPQDWRSNWLAITNAMGYSQREGIDAYLAKKTPEQLAAAKGIPADLVPDPAYPPTRKQIEQLQGRLASQKEIEVLDEFITKSQSPYATRIGGYSPQLAKDMFSNDPKTQDKVADFVAAKMLQVEGFAARFKGLGGNVSEAAIDKLMKESLADFKIPGVALNETIWNKASKKVTQKIIEAGNAANKTILSQGRREQATAGNEKKGINYDPETGAFS